MRIACLSLALLLASPLAPPVSSCALPEYGACLAFVPGRPGDEGPAGPGGLCQKAVLGDENNREDEDTGHPCLEGMAVGRSPHWTGPASCSRAGSLRPGHAPPFPPLYLTLRTLLI